MMSDTLFTGHYKGRLTPTKPVLCSCIFRKSNLSFVALLVEKGKKSALHQQKYVQKSTFCFFPPFLGSKKDEFTTQKVFPNTKSKKVFFDGGR
jgi:hypothetical protein